MVAFRPTEGLPQPAATVPSTLVAPVSLAVHAAAAYDQNELAFRLSQIEVGQQMTAQIQSQLGGGSYLVKVADTVVQMNLPNTLQAGDQVQVTLIEKNPRPTFLLSSEAAPPPPESSIMTLSTAGKLVTSLMQLPNARAEASVSASAPLLSQAGAQPAQLADALHQALGQSGLFYESHLGQWLLGKFSLASLLNEPQARQSSQLLMPAGQEQPAATNAPPFQPVPAQAALAVDQTGLAAVQAALTEPLVTEQPAPAAVQATRSTVAADAVAVMQGAAGSTATAALTQIVQQQLQVLEQNRFVWQGMPWPGQSMQWEIEERSSQSASPGYVPGWNSRLHLTLPGLGAVVADLALSDGRVTIRLQADSDNGIRRLRGGQQALAEAFATAGIRLDSVVVQPATASGSA